jgi:hypothetical protein
MPAMPPVITEIGLDAQRRLDHAEKDVGRGRKPDGAADPHRPFEHECEAANDRRQDAPIERQRGEHAHHQHHGQRLQRKDEVGAWLLHREGQGAAADIAEHERGTRLGRFRDRVDGIADHVERRLQLRDLEHQHREHDGNR